MWHAQTIGYKGLDSFYVLSSLGLILIAVISLLRDRAIISESRRMLWIAMACVVAVIVFLGLLSLQFDFGACINPSRERPYFSRAV
jgi:protein-S-isoprenylcysteine O-methyltransferase Ste14